MTITIFAYLLFSLFTFTALAKCPRDTTQGAEPDTCYIFMRKLASWFTAQKRCAKRGGYLADVASEETNDFLTKHAILRFEKSKAWLGGTIGHETDSWTWEPEGTSFSVSYTN